MATAESTATSKPKVIAASKAASKPENQVVKKAAVKKAATRPAVKKKAAKPAVKKAAVKKAAVKKVAVKKATPKKAAVKKKAGRPVAKKATTRKAAVKKSPIKKGTFKRTAPKASIKKVAMKKGAVKKGAGAVAQAKLLRVSIRDLKKQVKALKADVTSANKRADALSRLSSKRGAAITRFITAWDRKANASAAKKPKSKKAKG